MGINIRVQDAPKQSGIIAAQVKLEKDIRSCMRCQFFYGNNSQCLAKKCVKEEKKYTGTMVQLKTKLDVVGGEQVNRPQKEWVRVENTHEPIITYPRYIRAVSSLKQQKAKESKNFKNIYYCGCCGRALFNAHYGTVFCKQRSFKTDSDCRDIEIKKHEADMSVLEAVKEEAELFLGHDKLSRQVIKRNSPLSVIDRINSTIRSIEAAQKS